MITVGMNYEVLAGKEKAFEEKFYAVGEALNGAEGHTESKLFRDVKNPSSYLIISDWESRDAFTDFIKSPAFREVTNWGREEILAGRPSHKVYG